MTPDDSYFESLLKDGSRIHINPSREELMHCIRDRNEGSITGNGSVVVGTGEFTGRTPGDKYIVETPAAETRVWWGNTNQDLPEDQFESILKAQMNYFQKKEKFIQYLSAGCEDSNYLPLRVITQTAWHSLFSLNLFKPASLIGKNQKIHPLTIIHTPDFEVDPTSAGTKSGVFVVINLDQMLVLIGGTSYAGEIKKSVFSVMNYLFPLQGMLTMHCSANLGQKGDTALFFGLSGTGKTTLSSSPDRELIGDDEHGWTEEGLTNLEGGCYAKTIRLKKTSEPIIWKAAQSAGSVLENVAYDPRNDRPDFDSAVITENTRVAYPLSAVTNLDPMKVFPHPKTIFFLTADAFGILPPIARLDNEQAIYHFLSGYTAKIAATEQGLGSEPCATFSTCFAEPFLPLPPRKYADLFTERITQHQPDIWLVNTGWIAGSFDTGHRIELKYTRAMIAAALRGEISLDEGRFDNTFRFRIPLSVSGVPRRILDPREMWKDKSAYDLAAERLRDKFEQNFRRLEN